MSKTDTASNHKNNPLPVWAKVLIIGMVIGFIDVLAFSIFAYGWIFPKFVNCTKPDTIKHVASHIATFNQQALSGYTFQSGFDLFQIYFLMAEHMTDQQAIFLITYPVVTDNSHTIVEDMVQDSLRTKHAGTNLNSVTSKGELDVGHQKMPYVIGTWSNHEDTVEGMFGRLVPANSNHTISVFAVAPAGRHFDPTVTINFLKSIEKWND